MIYRSDLLNSLSTMSKSTLCEDIELLHKRSSVLRRYIVTFDSEIWLSASKLDPTVDRGRQMCMQYHYRCGMKFCH